MKKKLIVLFIIGSFFQLTSCKKWIVAPAPTNALSGKDVYLDNTTAANVLTGIYTELSAGSFASGLNSYSVTMGLYADELTGTTASLQDYIVPYTNSFVSNASLQGSAYWADLYTYIYRCNAAVEGLNKSGSLTAGVKQQLIGEAKFIRALCYFYLIQLHGDVPLTISSDYRQNLTLARSPQNLVYDQIVKDLTEAESSLSDNYLNADVQTVSSDRVRPTKWAAKALLSWVYLYTGKWQSSVDKANEVIQNTALFSLTTDLNATFLANSTEAIWQLQPVNANENSADGAFFIMITDPTPSDNPLFLTQSLLNAFETGDQRKANWVGTFVGSTDTYYYPYKYKVKSGSDLTEYTMVLRLAELYLNRAEAETQLGNLDLAKADLNTIRSRAGLGNTTASSQSELMAAVLKERQTEMFAEFGSRWFDIKRSGQIDQIMTAASVVKGSTWASYKQLLPLPYADLQADRNLKQNPGY